MVGQKNFKKDKSRSTKNEKWLRNLFEELKKAKSTTEVDKENRSYWDFEVECNDGTKYLVEAKEDISCQIWGNIVLEFSSRDKPSGIEITKADYWVYTAHHKHDSLVGVYMIKTSELKRLVKEKKYVRIKWNGGDPGSQTNFYLFSLNVLKENSELLRETEKSVYEQELFK